MLEAGIKGRKESTVTKELSAEALGSGLLPVYATPAMVALMEGAASESVAPYLEEGMTTVGTALNIKHTAATPIGMRVFCESTLTEIDGRRLVFSVTVFDECGEIGSGTHERFVIKSDKFMAKTNAKLEK